MSETKENLFDGIQIMSPGELESSISGEETDDSTTATTEETPELVVAPVKDTTGDLGDDPEEPKIVSPKEELENKEVSEPTTVVSDDKKEAFYKAMMKEFIDDGIISAPESEEELEGSLDKLKELMKGTLEKSFKGMTSQWKNNFSGAKKKFLEIEDSFSGADQAIQAAQDLEFFDNVTEDSVREDTNLQKNLYYRYLKSKNFSDEDAAEQIEDADAIGKLEDKALKAIPQLKKHANGYVTQAKEAKVAEEQKWEKQREESYNNLMSSIDTKEAFIDGLKLNKVTKEKLKANITKPVYTDDDGKGYTSLMYKQMRNPTEFEMLINYYDSMGLFDLDKQGSFKPNISKIKNVAKTQAVSEIDKVIASSNERGVGRNTSVESSQKAQGILDFLERGMGKTRKK
tara:strand:- start:278 stop:1480 length:1203 start_codon:yes stop_codon:yes gene_type:complete